MRNFFLGVVGTSLLWASCWPKVPGGICVVIFVCGAACVGVGFVCAIIEEEENK